jgi:hypothetical protein
MEEIAKDTTLDGINCFVDGTIPPSAGLSSSSALVVAAALVTLWVIGEHSRVSRSGVNFTNILRVPFFAQMCFSLIIDFGFVIFAQENWRTSCSYNVGEI